MDKNVKDPGAVGGKHTGLWTILQGRDTSHTDTWVGDVGLDTMDGPYPKGLPPQGGPLDDEETAVTASLQEVGMPNPGGGYLGGRDRDDQYLHFLQ